MDHFVSNKSNSRIVTFKALYRLSNRLLMRMMDADRAKNWDRLGSYRRRYHRVQRYARPFPYGANPYPENKKNEIPKLTIERIY